MKLTFDSSLTDALESTMKMYQRTGLMKRWKRQGYFTAPVVVILSALLFPGEWPRKIIFGGIMGALFATLYPEQCKKSIRKRLRRMITAQRGTDQSIPFEINVNRQGVEACWSKSRVAFGWDKVVEIDDRVDAVDFYMNDNSVITAPPHAFTDDAQRRRFLAEARKHYAQTAAPI